MSNEPWLIKNSTKEERQKRLNAALAIQLTGGKSPLPEDMALDEISEKLIEKYREN